MKIALFPNHPRDKDGNIRIGDLIRIRSEKHKYEPGDTYNPRHHKQHYHVDIKRDPNKGWKHDNKEILKPEGYEPKTGTGFLPGEEIPPLNFYN